MHSNFIEKRWFFPVLACLFFSCATFLLVGSFESRLANVISDDHPVVLARMFNHPEQWALDFGLVTGKAFAVASLPNLLASYAAKIDSSFPWLLSWVYIFIQNLGLALALLIYQKNFSRDALSSFIGACFVYFSAPWTLNLAYYPSLIHSPYPGHLVMPFLVLGMNALLEQKWKTLAIAVALSGLIHPSLTLQFVALALLYRMFQGKRKGLTQGLWAFLPGVLTSFCLPFLLVPKAENPLSSSELLPSALKNLHLVPWNNEIFWSWELPSMFGVFWLGYLAVHHFKDRFPYLKSFYWANVTAVLLAGVFHFLFVKLEFLPGILLCPLRITVLSSVLLIPVGFQYLVEKIKSNQIDSVLISSSLLFFVLFSEIGLFWGPLLALTCLHFHKAPRTTMTLSLKIYLAWLILFFLAGSPLRYLTNDEIGGQIRYGLAPAFNLKISQILYAVISSFALSAVLLWKRKASWNLGLILFMVMFAGIFKSFEIGNSSQSESFLARWEVQKWAQTNTPQESVFLIGWDSWRGVAERQAVVIDYKPNSILPYFKFREPLNHEKKLETIYRKYGVKRLEELPRAALLDFASLFKAQYFVASTEGQSLLLPIAFRNKHFRVYSLLNEPDKIPS